MLRGKVRNVFIKMHARKTIAEILQECVQVKRHMVREGRGSGEKRMNDNSQRARTQQEGSCGVK